MGERGERTIRVTRREHHLADGILQPRVVHGGEQAQTAPERVAAALERRCAVEVGGEEQLAQPRPCAHVRDAGFGQEDHEGGQKIVQRAVGIVLCALAHARVVRVDGVRKVTTQGDIEEVVSALQRVSGDCDHGRGRGTRGC